MNCKVDYSASQIAEFRDCPTKWYFTSVLKHSKGETAATGRGKSVHRQLEVYFKGGKAPTDPLAKALLPLLPLRRTDAAGIGVYTAEHPFSITTEVGTARGFIDLVVWHPQRVAMSPHDTAWGDLGAVVYDHKTTKSDQYVKTPDILVADPQPLLYGLATRVAMAKYTDPKVPIGMGWNYSFRDGTAAKPVRLVQGYEEMEQGLATHVFPVVRDMAQFRKDYPAALEPVEDHEATKKELAMDPTARKVFKIVGQAPESLKDASHDLEACDKYGGCPHRVSCPHYSGEVKGPSGMDRLLG